MILVEKEDAVKLFEDRKIRVGWNEDDEKWYFSIVDVIGILTDSPNPRNYWKVLKGRLKEEGSELVTNCNQLKLQAADGKFYKMDVADTEQLLRIIQSVPSKKAEPFKMWLAKVGSERVDNREGYIKIKIKEPDKWESKHKFIYESHYGKIEKGRAKSLRLPRRVH